MPPNDLTPRQNENRSRGTRWRFLDGRRGSFFPQSNKWNGLSETYTPVSPNNIQNQSDSLAQQISGEIPLSRGFAPSPAPASLELQTSQVAPSSIPTALPQNRIDQLSFGQQVQSTDPIMQTGIVSSSVQPILPFNQMAFQANIPQPFTTNTPTTATSYQSNAIGQEQVATQAAPVHLQNQSTTFPQNQVPESVPQMQQTTPLTDMPIQQRQPTLSDTGWTNTMQQTGFSATFPTNFNIQPATLQNNPETPQTPNTPFSNTPEIAVTQIDTGDQMVLSLIDGQGGWLADSAKKIWLSNRALSPSQAIAEAAVEFSGMVAQQNPKDQKAQLLHALDKNAQGAINQTPWLNWQDVRNQAQTDWDAFMSTKQGGTIDPSTSAALPITQTATEESSYRL